MAHSIVLGPAERLLLEDREAQASVLAERARELARRSREVAAEAVRAIAEAHALGDVSRMTANVTRDVNGRPNGIDFIDPQA